MVNVVPISLTKCAIVLKLIYFVGFFQEHKRKSKGERRPLNKLKQAGATVSYYIIAMGAKAWDGVRKGIKLK